MNTGVSVRIRDVEARVGEVWTRIPFRYGNACLTAVPLLHVRATVEDAGGRVSRGLAADCLPPRWFDKDPGKDFRRNVADQIAAIDCARRVWLEEGSAPAAAATVHAHWERAYPAVLDAAAAIGLNRLTASFGSSLLERAAIDAVCRLEYVAFHRAVRDGVLGWAGGEELPAEPLAAVSIRHTVGLGDAVLASDVPDDERLGDGLPESLEESVRAYGLRFFKVKVSGDGERDLERLERIGGLLERERRGDWALSLDGNEQYRDLDGLEELLARLDEGPEGRRLLERILFIEQPLAREVALAESARSQIERLARARLLAPIIIDESDDDLDSLPRAIALGYRGCSIKNCKGVFKALGFRALVGRLNRDRGEDRFFQTAEDLANLAVVPLQQDLTTVATLGIPHAERNGHHFFRGLSHLPAAELAAAVEAHTDLYEVRDGLARLRIRDGRVACASLHGPGYGYACEIAFEERVPLEEWRFERLGLE